MHTCPYTWQLYSSQQPLRDTLSCLDDDLVRQVWRVDGSPGPRALEGGNKSFKHSRQQNWASKSPGELCQHCVSPSSLESWFQPRDCNRSTSKLFKPSLWPSVTTDPYQMWVAHREKVLVLASFRQLWVCIRGTQGVQAQRQPLHAALCMVCLAKGLIQALWDAWPQPLA